MTASLVATWALKTAKNRPPAAGSTRPECAPAGNPPEPKSTTRAFVQPPPLEAPLAPEPRRTYLAGDRGTLPQSPGTSLCLASGWTGPSLYLSLRFCSPAASRWRPVALRAPAFKAGFLLLSAGCSMAVVGETVDMPPGHLLREDLLLKLHARDLDPLAGRRPSSPSFPEKYGCLSRLRRFARRRYG
jgi:hypothetical protein